VGLSDHDPSSTVSSPSAYLRKAGRDSELRARPLPNRALARSFERPTKGEEMYIGAGAIVLILLIVLLIYMLG